MRHAYLPSVVCPSVRLSVRSFLPSPVCLPVHPSVSSRETTRLPLKRFSWNFKFVYFSKISPGNSSLIKLWQKIGGTLLEFLYTLVIKFPWILLKMRNISDTFIEKINRHFVFSIPLHTKSSYLWDSVEKYCSVEQATNDNIIRRKRFACWIVKATDKHSEYVILIDFPPQQLLHERSSVLRCTYIACIVSSTRRWSLRFPFFRDITLWQWANRFREFALSPN